MNRWVLITLGVAAIVVAFVLLRRKPTGEKIFVPEARGTIAGPSGPEEVVRKSFVLDTAKFTPVNIFSRDKPPPLENQTPIGGGFVKTGVLR